MRKINADKMNVLIEGWGIKPAFKRDVSFLGHSIYGEVYVRDLIDFAGFGYGAIGGMWKDGLYQSMSNDELVAKRVKKLLGKGLYNLKQVRFLAMDKYREGRRKFEILQKGFSESPSNTTKDMINVYKNYFPALGFYNALMRFAGDKDCKDLGFSAEFIEEIGKERNESATLYNDVEHFFKKTFPILGNILNIDGNLIRYMSKKEILNILSGAKISKKILVEAEERQKQYFHLFTEDEELSEYLVSDEQSVNKIYKNYFVVDVRGDMEIKGQGVFPGVVRGYVKILNFADDINQIKIGKGDILIAAHTHPRYLSLVKKSSAVVTDEGGILSHAAIICRELKIPCIVGTKIGTKILKGGDMVEVDANNGVVKKIK